MGYKKLAKVYTLNNYDFDCNKHCNPYTLLSYLQDIAQYQSEQLGIDEAYLQENHCGWALIKYDIDILRQPRYRETLKIETYPTGTKFMFAFRQFFVYGEDGTKLADIKSCWALMDLVTRKPMMMSQEMINAYGYDVTKNDVFYFKNISKVKTPTAAKAFEVRYSDIDINHHINNCKYLSWALDTVPTEILTQHQIQRIEIVYKKEGYLNDTLTSKVEITEHGDNPVCIHEICNQDRDVLCQLRTEWSNNS